MARVIQHTEFLTKQQIFDRVATHLLMQGVASLDKRRNICRYRGPNGLQCAIGCLIPDEHYKKFIEGASISRFLFSKFNPVGDKRKAKGSTLGKVLLKSGINIHDEEIFSLCKTLQYIHDEQGLRSCLPENKTLRDIWTDSLLAVATEHSLSAGVIGQVLSSLEAQQ